MTILDETGDVQTLSRFRIPVLNVYFTAGRIQRGLEVLSRDGDWQTQPIDLENLASRALRAIALAYMGRLTEARQDLQTALRVAATDQRRVSWVHAYIVEVDYLFGRYDNSIHHAQTALISADDFGSSMFASMAKRALATAHVLRGDDALAAEVLEEGRAAVAEGAAGHQFEGAHLALLAEVRLRLGEHDVARSLAEEALASSIGSGARLWEIRSRIALANVLLETDAEAQEFNRLVICLQDLIAATGATIFQGFVHSIQARWYSRHGQPGQVKLAWEQAHKCFVECGAQARAEQVAQAIAAVSSYSVKA